MVNTYRHYVVRDVLFRMSKELEISVRREPPLPVQMVGCEARRPDLLFPDWDQGRDFFFDVVGTSPLAQTYRGSFVPGGVPLFGLLGPS